MPGGVQDEQAELLELDEGVGDRLLHELLLGERAALCPAAERPLAHHLERLAHRRHGAHRVMDAAAAEAGLCDQEALALAAEEVLARDAHGLVADVGVVAVAERLVAEARQAHDVQARRVARHEEHRRALVDRHVGVRDRHRDQELGQVGVGGEVLLAVDHPGVAVAHGPAAELPRVGAALWLGHGEAGDDVAVEERLEVLPLLLLGPVVREDLRVARVGGLAAEDVRRPHRPAEDLVQQRELHLAVARAAELGAEMAGPEAVLPHLCLQRIGDLLVHRVPPVVRRGGVREREVERLDLPPHEHVRPVELLLKLGLRLEIPGHQRRSPW